jgi:PhoH-like ATPase
MEEKMAPWIAPIEDNLKFLLGNDQETLQRYMEMGTIEVEALTYIRGRSIANAFIIIDEAQNLSMHELKTIITRVGENTKIVLTGDIEQIDNTYVDATSNGLTYAVEKFKEYEIAGHITLQKGERSELATLAAKIL